MELEPIRQQLQRTCLHIGAAYQLEESEGEWHALIIQGSHWWNLLIGDMALLASQLEGIRRYSMH